MYLPLDGPAVYGSITVTSTPQELKVDDSVLDGRKLVTVQPVDGDIYYGYSASVTTSSGTKIIKGQLFMQECTDQLPIYLVAASDVDVRITEVA